MTVALFDLGKHATLSRAATELSPSVKEWSAWVIACLSAVPPPFDLSFARTTTEEVDRNTGGRTVPNWMAFEPNGRSGDRSASRVSLGTASVNNRRRGGDCQLLADVAVNELHGHRSLANGGGASFR
jgi:hypothetical protein